MGPGIPICRWSRLTSLRCDYTKNWALKNFTVTGIASKTSTACTHQENRIHQRVQRIGRPKMDAALSAVVPVR